MGALLSAAEMVGDRVDTASKIVSRTVTNPVVKVLALGTGTKRAVKRMRGSQSEADAPREQPVDQRRGGRAPRSAGPRAGEAMIPKRVFWLRVGYTAGIGHSWYAARKVKEAARRYTPDGLQARVTDTVSGLSRDVKAAVTEGRTAMREREAELLKPRAADRTG